MGFENSSENKPLELYISYEYLPVAQHIKMLEAVDRTYKIISLFVSLRGPLPNYFLGWDDIDHPLYSELFSDPLAKKRSRWDRLSFVKFEQYFNPLCITSVEIGNSINWKFKPSEKKLPKVKIRDGDFHVSTPKWAVVAIVTSAILLTGIGGAALFLEAKKTHYETKKIRLEIEKLQEDLKVLERLHSLNKNLFKTTPLYEKLESNRKILARELSKPNIYEVRINNEVFQKRKIQPM